MTVLQLTAPPGSPRGTRRNLRRDRESLWWCARGPAAFWCESNTLAQSMAELRLLQPTSALVSQFSGPVALHSLGRWKMPEQNVLPTLKSIPTDRYLVNKNPQSFPWRVNHSGGWLTSLIFDGGRQSCAGTSQEGAVMKRRPSVSVPKSYAAAWARQFSRSPEELAEQAKASAAPQQKVRRPAFRVDHGFDGRPSPLNWRPLPSRVQDAQHANQVFCQVINQDVIPMRYQLAGADNASRPPLAWVIYQASRLL